MKIRYKYKYKYNVEEKEKTKHGVGRGRSRELCLNTKTVNSDLSVTQLIKIISIMCKSVLAKSTSPKLSSLSFLPIFEVTATNLDIPKTFQTAKYSTRVPIFPNCPHSSGQVSPILYKGKLQDKCFPKSRNKKCKTSAQSRIGRGYW